MTNSEDKNKRKPLGLQGSVDEKSLQDMKSGAVQQSFSRGKSKSIEVEVKKKRGAASMHPSASQRNALTDTELSARMNAIANAENIFKEKEEKKTREEDARKQISEKSVKEDAAQVYVPIVDFPAKEKERSRFPKKDRPHEEVADDIEESAPPKKQELREKLSKSVKKRAPIGSAARIEGDEEEAKTRSGPVFGIKKLRKKDNHFRKTRKKIMREVKISSKISVSDLADAMSEKVGAVTRVLMNMGVMATSNHAIDPDTAELIIGELGHKCIRVIDKSPEEELLHEDREQDLQKRPPVVTIMGHVDHGKTSLLDAMRKTDVVGREAGGITQHIGAYQITIESGEKITFIDTPGHEAFTHMRARGAHVTDIVILVVAADDGIKAQTIEAIQHAKASNAPVIVAINKIDKPGANPDKVRQELLSYEIVVEDLGGDVLDEEVSAIKGTNLDKLQEAILLQSEILALRANPDRLGYGSIVETHIKKGHGTVVTVLVKNGTLRKGDIVVIGENSGRIRMMFDDKGNSVSEAPPSFPVEISGISGSPLPGDMVMAVESESQANKIIAWRKERSASAISFDSDRKIIADSIGQFINDQNVSEFAIIIKADVQGSIEGLSHEIAKIKHAEVRPKIILSGVGDITESDVSLAKVSSGVILGFNVKATANARADAERDGVKILYHNIIYRVVEDIKAFLSGMLSPDYQEERLGFAEVIQLFNLTKHGHIAGCKVKNGVIRRGAKARVKRNDEIILETDIKSVRHVKDDMKEAKEGYECGISFAEWGDIKLGDIVECFSVKEIQRSVE